MSHTLTHKAGESCGDVAGTLLIDQARTRVEGTVDWSLASGLHMVVSS